MDEMRLGTFLVRKAPNLQRTFIRIVEKEDGLGLKEVAI